MSPPPPAVALRVFRPAAPRMRRAIAFCLIAAAAGGAWAGCGRDRQEKQKSEFEIEKEYKRGPATFTVQISRGEISIADRLKLSLEARIGEEYEAKLPEFGEKLEQFGIADYRASQPELSGNGEVLIRKTYELEPFLSGDYKIPPMKVLFWKKTEGEGKKHEVESEELLVKVKSLLPEKSAALDIKDIAPPVGLPRRTPGWLYWLAGAALCAGGTAAGIVVWLRRRRRTESAARRPAHEIAFDELEKLLAQKLIEKGEVKPFYDGLSDILRRYTENRFGLRAPERTTEEFLCELKASTALGAAHKNLLGEFLRHCDMVKFAEHQPAKEEIQGAFDACKKFIAETEEKQAPEQGADQPAPAEAGHAV